MGSETLVLDHQIIFQLWSDSMFWECAPDWEADREQAEMEASAAAEELSPLSIRYSPLYNAWINQLELCNLREPDKVKQITDYVHKKRNYRQEKIVLPVTKDRRTLVLLSQGVEKCRGEFD